MERISKEILSKINLERKILGLTKTEFSLRMERSPQWLTNLERNGWDFKMPDWIKAGEVLGINAVHLLPDYILADIHNENLENAIKVLTKKGYKIILEESEQKKTKSDDSEL